MTELDSAVLAAARAAVEAAEKALHDILVEVWGDDA